MSVRKSQLTLSAIGAAGSGDNADINKLTVLTGPTRLGGQAQDDWDAVTLGQVRTMLSGGSSGPNMNGVMTYGLGVPVWFLGTRTLMLAGHLPYDGQLVKRADWPDLWAAINAGLFTLVSEADWISKPSFRGAYTTGDGSTTFRMPDLNGVRANGDTLDGTAFTGPGSIKGLVLRGSGTGYVSGSVDANAAPDITGTVGAAVWAAYGASTGAFSTSGPVASPPMLSNTTTPAPCVLFKASNSNPSYGRAGADGAAATEVRMNSVTGIWICRANGLFASMNTNFHVINQDTSMPSAGTTVYGGDVYSTYKVAGKDQVKLRARSKMTVGGAATAEISVIDSRGTSDVVKTYTLPTGDGELLTTSNVGYTAGKVPVIGSVSPIYDSSGGILFASNNVPALSLAGAPAISTRSALRVSNGGNNSAAAVMHFVRDGYFAYFFGMDHDYQLAIGGGSLGNKRYRVYSEWNTTVDGNGFIKAASPIVKIYGDGSIETNEESKGAICTRLDVGVYEIGNILGFNSDPAWGGPDGGIEIPVDRNKLPTLWVDYEVEANGSIILKTYHRTHPSAPPFARNEVAGLADGDPIDIPSGRCVDLRVQMPEDSLYAREMAARQKQLQDILNGSSNGDQKILGTFNGLFENY